MSLDFTREELSGQLYAHSAKNGFVSYWIEEGAWSHLSIVSLTHRGPVVGKPECYNTLEDAKNAAQEHEDSL